MAASLRLDGALVPIAKLSVRTNGVFRAMQTLKVMSGGTLRTVATFSITPTGPSAISAVAAPTEVSVTKTGAPARTVTTPVVTVTPTGGVLPYSYAWARVGGDASVSATNPAFASTAFQALINATEKAATFRCTVTDGAGSLVTCDVSAFFQTDF